MGAFYPPRGVSRGKFLPRRVGGDGDGEAFPVLVPRGDTRLGCYLLNLAIYFTIHLKIFFHVFNPCPSKQ